MEQFSCCSLHLQCTAEGRCVVERGLMAEEKEEMKEACSLAKRLPLGEPALPEPQKDIPNTPNTPENTNPENTNKDQYEQLFLF